MALTITPNCGTNFPDVIAKETVSTNGTGTADIFDGAKNIHSLSMDNTLNTGVSAHNTYFKFYNAVDVDPSSSLPNLVIRVEDSTKTEVIIADGLSFTTAITLRAVREVADTGNTAPAQNTATLIVGS